MIEKTVPEWYDESLTEQCEHCKEDHRNQRLDHFEDTDVNTSYQRWTCIKCDHQRHSVFRLKLRAEF